MEAREVIVERTSKCYVDLGKSIKIGTALHTKAMSCENPGKHLVKVTDDLQYCLEKSEKIQSDVGFVSKWKKMPDGTALSVEAAQELQRRAAGYLTEMLDAGKAVKALLPKPTKDE